MESSRRRVLVVANRTATTPDLMDAVKRHADEQPTAFTLLIPGEVDAVRAAVARDHYERIIVLTRPRRVARWLRRDLPKRIEALGVPVEVFTPQPRRGAVADGLGLSWPQCSLCRVSEVEARGRAIRF